MVSLVAEPRRCSPQEAQALWREYRATGDVRVRNRLVMTFAPLVKYIVFRKARELPARCELADLMSCGLEALITSIERYDPARGATLEQFAWTRIHGAVLDELRRLDWAPRSLRRWERDIARARGEFAGSTGRPPTHAELATALGLSADELRNRQDEISVCDVTSLNALVAGDDDSSVERIDTIAESDQRLDPETALAIRQAKARFRRAFEGLPERERSVAVMLYVNNMTLREVGDVLGVSESRVSQIHTGLKRALRARLADSAALFAAVA